MYILESLLVGLSDDHPPPPLILEQSASLLSHVFHFHFTAVTSLQASSLKLPLGFSVSILLLRIGTTMVAACCCCCRCRFCVGNCCHCRLASQCTPIGIVGHFQMNSGKFFSPERCGSPTAFDSQKLYLSLTLKHCFWQAACT